jgi:hypothetical protein
MEKLNLRVRQIKLDSAPILKVGYRGSNVGFIGFGLFLEIAPEPGFIPESRVGSLPTE